ncbi:MAG: AAA family ATPase [Chloroflexota bacterium]
MPRRLSSPVFVGRSDEFATLVAAARAAQDSNPSIVLVGGEAGVGKSRLVAEAAARFREDGWLVLEGGSVALGDDALPFGPIVEVLRALARDVDPDTIAAAAGPTLPVLARLVPELLPQAATDDGSVMSGSSGADWLQIRIFEGMLSLLDGLAVERPVLLVIEDLHWADRSTRDLLAFLWRNMREERLCIVGTFRSDDLHRRHPLTAWLAEAERQPHVDRLDLVRFGQRELIDLLTGILGAPPTPRLLESIARRSDGNAFFAEELVAASHREAGAREHLPDTLRGVLLVRLSQARETAAHLIEVAAVAGREVEHDVLAEVSGASAVDLATAIREAVDAQLLVVDRTAGVERYQFRHALVQEAAYDQLLPSERRALHGAYARAMASRPVPGGGAAEASRLVEIAHHWTAAHESARALPAAIAAGDASRAVFAYGEASRQYELAIELWDLADPADLPAGRDLVGLFDAASASANLVGDASRAVDHARHALELVDARSPGTAAADREARALARERLGAAVGLAGDTAISIEALEEAVELLDGTAASTTRARILAGLAANLMLAARASESIGFAREAMEMARTIGDTAIESRAMSILGVDLATLGDIGGGIELLRGSVALADPADDPTIVPRAYANLGSVLEMGGFVEEALEVALAGADQIARFGSELGFLTFLEVNAAAMFIELARYPEAAELLDRNVSRALPGLATIHVHTTLAHLAIRTGDLAAARRHLASAEAEAGRIADAQFVIDLCACATEIADWDGDPAAAVAIARDGFERLAEMDDGVILGQLAIPAIRAAADIAVAARSGRDAVRAAAAVDAARDVIERYRASTERLTAPDALATREIAWRMDLCNAELSRASGDDRPEHWAALRPALSGRPSPFLEAYALWREAEAHSGAGDQASATIAVRDASAIARRIGAALLVERIDGLARRLRIDLLPDPVSAGADAPVAPAPPAEEPAAPADPFGLTTREREVLELVAEGYTNRRIADALFISESTAGVHVSHILAKLGVESRTEAATIAVRLGLDRASAVP